MASKKALFVTLVDHILQFEAYWSQFFIKYDWFVMLTSHSWSIRCSRYGNFCAHNNDMTDYFTPLCMRTWDNYFCWLPLPTWVESTWPAVGTFDMHSYGGQQKPTSCDAHGLVCANQYSRRHKMVTFPFRLMYVPCRSCFTRASDQLTHWAYLEYRHVKKLKLAHLLVN